MMKAIMDSQWFKRIAAAEYDYDSDPRWNHYCSNLLHISPPHLVHHFKLNFYHRYIDPKLVVEDMFCSNSNDESISRPSSTTSSSPHHPTSEISGTDHPNPNPTPLWWDPQTIHFSLNLWVLIVAVLAILPLIPKSISHRAYRLALMGTTFSSLYSLCTMFEKPEEWHLLDLHLYLGCIGETKDFIFFVYSITFMTSNICFRLALISIMCRSLGHVAKFLRPNFTRSFVYRKYLDKACAWVESNSTILSILSALAEIGVGFVLIISTLLWQHNLLHTLIYCQLLNLMYLVDSDYCGYHQRVWSIIGWIISPLTNCFWFP